MNTPLWPAASPPAPWQTLQDMVARGIVPSNGQLLALLQQIGAVTSATMIQTGQGLTGGPLPGSAELRLANVPAKHVLANMSDIEAPPVPTPVDGLGWVRSEREVRAGTGLEGGGDLTANRTLSLGAVNPAGAGARPTVDIYGRVTELGPLRAEDLSEALHGQLLVQFATMDAVRAFDGPALVGVLAGRAEPGDGAGGNFAVKIGDYSSVDDGWRVLVDSLDRRWWRQGHVPIYREVTAAGVIAATNLDTIIGVNKGAGSPTILNLPATLFPGKPLSVLDVKGDAEANKITVVGPINGGASYEIVVNYGYLHLLAVGPAAWRIIG